MALRPFDTRIIPSVPYHHLVDQVLQMVVILKGTVSIFVVPWSRKSMKGARNPMEVSTIRGIGKEEHHRSAWKCRGVVTSRKYAALWNERGFTLLEALFSFLRHYLSELASVYPIFERWTIFLGFLYIVVLLGFPKGLAGGRD